MAADHCGQRVLLDVAVTHAVSSVAGRLARAAMEDGVSACREESHKRNKYYNAVGLVPFVFETGGRIGPAARALVRRLAPTEPAHRTAAINNLWQTLEVAMQKHNAIMIHNARSR